jgi:CBS domain-containing protein
MERSMKIADLMRTDMTTVGPDATVGDVVVTLADGHLSALPVVDQHGALIGVVSTTDILQAEAGCESSDARDRLFEDTLVSEVMTRRPVTIAPDADVREAAQQMLYLEVHRLYVEEDNKLRGVISQSDVVRAVAGAKI